MSLQKDRGDRLDDLPINTVYYNGVPGGTTDDFWHPKRVGTSSKQSLVGVIEPVDTIPKDIGLGDHNPLTSTIDYDDWDHIVKNCLGDVLERITDNGTDSGIDLKKPTDILTGVWNGREYDLLDMVAHCIDFYSIHYRRSGFGSGLFIIKFKKIRESGFQTKKLWRYIHAMRTYYAGDERDLANYCTLPIWKYWSGRSIMTHLKPVHGYNDYSNWLANKSPSVMHVYHWDLVFHVPGVINKTPVP